MGHTWEIDKWPLQWSPERPEDMWAGGKEKVVYLSPDSPNVLESLEDGVLYVIGGIIDQTVRPGMSLKEASKASVRHARLPVEAATGRSAEVEAARRELGSKLGPSNLGKTGAGSSPAAAAGESGEETAKGPKAKSSVSAADDYGRVVEAASGEDDKEQGAPDAVGAGPAAPAGTGGVRPSAGAHKRVVLNIDHVVLAITEFRVSTAVPDMENNKSAGAAAKIIQTRIEVQAQQRLTTPSNSKPTSPYQIPSPLYSQEHGSWPKALVRALPARVLRKYWIDAEPLKTTKAPVAASGASGSGGDLPSSGDGGGGDTAA